MRYPSGRSGSFSFPSEVTSVGHSAFSFASGLTEIVIPSRIIELKAGAFDSCTGLTSVTFETTWNPFLQQWRGVATIGNLAFRGCEALETITLPRTLSGYGLGESVFYGCLSLESIEVDPNNPEFASVDGILYNKSLDMLMLCPSGKTVADQIPNTVKFIDFGAFSHCLDLASVRLPSTVIYINDGSFSYCVSLTYIRIPSSVTHIGDEAFSGCSSLTNAYFSGAVAPSSVALNAFSNVSPDFLITFREGSSGYAAPYWYGYPSAAIPNIKPVLAGIGNRTIQPGQTITFTITATDVNKDDLVYSAVGNASQPAK